MTVPVVLPVSMLVPQVVPISLSVPVQFSNPVPPLVPVAKLVLVIIVVKSVKNAQAEGSCEEIYVKICLKIA